MTKTTSGLKIILSGMLARVPQQGGMVWAMLQYLIGLRQLGHDVHLIEPMPSDAITPTGVPFAQSANAEYFRQVATSFELEDTATLLNTDTRETVGKSYDDLVRLTKQSDVLINISGLLRDEALINHIPVRAYLDLDPAFTQLWNSVQGIDVGFDGHTHFVTIGMALGQPECSVPDCGLSWTRTLQPIVLTHWPVASGISHHGLTTVANWRGYGSIDHEGVFYGQKAHSLRPFFSLPQHTSEKFKLALAIHQDEYADLRKMDQYGWQRVDPIGVTDTPAAFQHFIQHSKAEFGFAKSGYVASRCGWFSDRSICYLASGRPVIAQETGFSDFLPAGDGLFAYSSVEDVLNSIDQINSNYAHHSAAARSLAEEYFDSKKILTSLLVSIGAYQ
jgi:hypothetical protein